MIATAAVDVWDGRAVRLRQGRAEALTDYGSARETLARWSGAGLARVHLVDLGGALGRGASLLPLLKWSRRALPTMEIRASGGIRSTREAREALEAGAGSVVLGSLPFTDPDEAEKAVDRLGADRVVAALDVREGRVRTHGWLEDSGRTLAEACGEVRSLGFTRALVTDVGRDGLLTGPDPGLYRGLEGSGLEAIASGGVRCREDLEALSAVPCVAEAVVGKALYEGWMRPEDLMEEIP